MQYDYCNAIILQCMRYIELFPNPIDNYKLYFFLADAVERDNFLSPNEAKEFGLIDHVLT